MTTRPESTGTTGPSWHPLHTPSWKLLGALGIMMFIDVLEGGERTGKKPGREQGKTHQIERVLMGFITWTLASLDPKQHEGRGPTPESILEGSTRARPSVKMQWYLPLKPPNTLVWYNNIPYMECLLIGRKRLRRLV